ncbi:DNA mismatch repair protein MutS [Nitrospira japonica]|uniref:DNA mismatch repair protein MutS n=1 Tax=Nitrospira japonica TaxID=1325564 RepID=A0A1W1I1P2_9BACT|nr:DNA mismatch repair protein MutS [Nitrospira japonica]SLM46928.1 DNA mismatch repair protein MutS [Nitrospira japonica]
MSDADVTPLMRQYHEIKRGYPEAILFFRVGDFYEMFGEDAKEASGLLSIALTSRDKSSAAPIPLCGVPHHAAQTYIAKLLKVGRTVALCEQVEDPRLAKGLVRREVVRLYTPGTLVDTEFLPAGESSFLTAVSYAQQGGVKNGPVIGLANLDVSTGEFWVTEFHGDQGTVESALIDELVRIEPKELLYAESDRSLAPLLGRLDQTRLCAKPLAAFSAQEATVLLTDHFGVHSLDGFGCAGLTVGLAASGAVWRYFRETQPTASLSHVRRLQRRWHEESMHLDETTIRNLELIRPLTGGDGRLGSRHATVLSMLDRTSTSMGSRLLREWLTRPLLDRKAIQSRLDAVGELTQYLSQRVALRSVLRTVQDLARLSSRIALGLAGPQECLALKNSLRALPELRSNLSVFTATLLADIRNSWDDCRDIYETIERAIATDAPMSVRDGNVIREGFHPQVDALRKRKLEGKDWITALESQERARTGIDSLKVRFNQVFGYYIEVTKANLSKVPADFIRKQTLANAERYMTPGLKDLEEQVTGAESQLYALEEELFIQVRERVAKDLPRLQSMAQALSHLDVLAGLSETAALHRYVQPTIDEADEIRIVEGRHPVVEQLSTDAPFVPNDTFLDGESHRVILLTGPNMAGKSTYLRQVALIVLLAQIGSFVPAAEAHIGLVDRIFTRVGASDNLAAGQSTFMVEMIESAQILNSATQKSLILLDEIGRGTSTYDGLSIAWAIAEYIHDRRFLGARTLFATHYHEMTQMETLRDGIRNYRVAVQERNGDVLFLRKIQPGGADKSYGIHVAKLAGLPDSVIIRAQEVLAKLEEPGSRTEGVHIREGRSDTARSDPQPHPLIEEVRQIDLFSLTPLDALNRLADLQKRATDSQ